MNKKILVSIVMILAILSGIFLGFISSKKTEKAQNKYTLNSPETSPMNENTIITTEPEPIVEIVETISNKKDTPIKAVYLTGWTAGSPSKRESTINNLKQYGFNGVVIDIKDEAGRLSYDSSVQTAIDIKASQKMISNIKDTIQQFQENDIYVIGRIVTFKDPLYAKNITDQAYKRSDGTLWKDSAGNLWPNPYDENYWNYPISLAKEAAELGFDEIQFDYIRFPSSEGKVKQIAFGFDSDTKSKSQVINNFLEKIMEELKEYNIVVSADVFGITTKRTGDFENIGQDFAKIARIVDVICPMVYPSHYAKNEYKLPNPDKDPYHTIYYAIKDAKDRISEEISSEDKAAIIRPYLQDFTATWLGNGNYINYGTDAVKNQIQACYDLRINQFTLWDPNNKYCFDALEKVTWISDEEYEKQLELENKQNIEENVVAPEETIKTSSN